MNKNDGPLRPKCSQCRLRERLWGRGYCCGKVLCQDCWTEHDDEQCALDHKKKKEAKRSLVRLAIFCLLGASLAACDQTPFGADGSPGMAGKDGSPGMTGAPGMAGKDGSPGMAGEQGPQGLQGPPGAGLGGLYEVDGQPAKPVNGQISASATCDNGDILISGGCALMQVINSNHNSSFLELVESTPVLKTSTWHCTYTTTVGTWQAQAIAICLSKV